MDFELELFGGAHLQRYTPESGDRVRYLKDPATAGTRWNTNTQSAGPTWLKQFQSTTKPIVSAAIAARGAMQANFQAATAVGGTWQTRLEALGDQGIKNAAANAEPMYVAGTLRGQANFLKAITKIIAAEASILPSIYAMASGTQAASEARMLSFSRQMHAQAGTLGAK